MAAAGPRQLHRRCAAASSQGSTFPSTRCSVEHQTPVKSSFPDQHLIALLELASEEVDLGHQGSGYSHDGETQQDKEPPIPLLRHQT